MECRLNRNNAKVFAKAVESLAKFGADLFVEAGENGLLLRAINPTRSAVGTFKFKRGFFENYENTSGVEQFCKITMKACRNVFRHMKQVESCELRICPEQSKFLVNVKCRYDQMKKVIISIVDEENITADVSADNTPNVISGSHKIFNEISSNFSSLEEEITFETQGDTLTAKNYIEQSRVNDRFMRSRLKLEATEFKTYKIAVPGTITFCLKEFRAFLLFAEAVNEHIMLKFHEAGSPVFFHIQSGDQIESVLIMSTLCPEDVSLHEELREGEVVLENTTIAQAQRRNARDTSTTTRSRTTKNTKERPAEKRISESQRKRELEEKRRRLISEATTISNEDDEELFFQFTDNSIRNNNNIRSGPSDSIQSNSMQSIEVARNARHRNSDERNPVKEPELNKDFPVGRESMPSTVPNDTQMREADTVSVTFFETEAAGNTEKSDDDINTDDCIPQSPQRKNVRLIFSRCFQETYIPEEPSPSSQAFVPDSDSDY